MSDEGGNTTVQLQPEDHSLTSAALRAAVKESVARLSSGIVEALKEADTDSLLLWLIAAAIDPLNRVYQTNPKAAADLLKAIWPIEYTVFQRYLDDNRFAPPVAAGIASTLASEDPAPHLIERLLIFTEIIPLMEEHFRRREWVLQELRDDLRAHQRAGRFQRLQVTLRSEQYTSAATSRGDLQIQVSASKPTIVAGEEFSVFVVINNPFDVPVVLYSVETQIPVELIDVVDRQRKRARIILEDEQARVHDSQQPAAASDRLRRILSLSSPATALFKLGEESLRLLVTQYGIRLKLAAEPESRIAQAVAASEVTSTITPFSQNIQIGTIEGAAQVIGTRIDKFQTVDIAIESASPRHLDTLLWRLDSFKRGLTPIVLQPGDSVVKQFILRTRRWLFFTPLAHSMQIQVRYGVDDRDHLDTVQFALTIQAAITATMTGAVLGGLAGGVARLLSDTQAGTGVVGKQLLSLALAVIFSAVLVVSFARKSGAQQIVSIEDFWGGLFLGFLVGFLGQNYALNLIVPRSPQTTPSAMA